MNAECLHAAEFRDTVVLLDGTDVYVCRGCGKYTGVNQPKITDLQAENKAQAERIEELRKDLYQAYERILYADEQTDAKLHWHSCDCEANCPACAYNEKIREFLEDYQVTKIQNMAALKENTSDTQ